MRDLTAEERERVDAVFYVDDRGTRYTRPEHEVRANVESLVRENGDLREKLARMREAPCDHDTHEGWCLKCGDGPYGSRQGGRE